MYIHIGNAKVIKSDDLIGIFDLDTTTVSKRTRQYLARAEKQGEVETVSFDLPKSFVVCAGKRRERQTVYITQLSPATLEKRCQTMEME